MNDRVRSEPVLVTARLALRELDGSDASFMLDLLNDPAFIAHIGDRGVRTLEQARAYVAAGPGDSYRRNGFGLWRVEERASGTPTGICGLVRRPALDDVDIGFAFLPTWRGQGHAREAARAVLEDARVRLGLSRVVAIVAPANLASARLLEDIGFGFERDIEFGEKRERLRLFAWEG